MPTGNWFLLFIEQVLPVFLALVCIGREKADGSADNTADDDFQDVRRVLPAADENLLDVEPCKHGYYTE